MKHRAPHCYTWWPRTWDWPQGPLTSGDGVRPGVHRTMSVGTQGPKLQCGKEALGVSHLMLPLWWGTYARAGRCGGQQP
eukprot:12567253-Prorocentrum_lima.AAC.1